MSNGKVRFLLGSFLALGALAAVYLVASSALFALSPGIPGSQETSVIEVRKGESPQEIARVLSSSGVVVDGRRFLFLGKIIRQWKKIKAGEYEVSAGQTPIEIFSVLTSGISIVHPVTVREGENMYEIAADLESKKLASKKRFLELCQDPKLIQSLGFAKSIASLEGYLFPDTYNFNRTMATEEMIRQMVRHFNEVWGEKEKARSQELGMSEHEIITMASIIEKETGAPQERPMIGSVFYNRLKKKMKLQSDPTTIYGMWANYTGNIHKADLSAANPYNTYYVPALPLGPISNPGRDAIHAALYPAQTEYFFFVSHNDGTHEFTRTYGEHMGAVKKFQLDPKARQGKSWRDLNKKSTGQ